jgi:transcriptional regulator with XRE-family HTH domain
MVQHLEEKQIAFGCLLKSAREEAGKTKKQVATEIGISEAAVENYELRHTFPPPQRAEKLAIAYQIKLPIFLQALKEAREEKENLKSGRSPVARRFS